MLAGPRGRELCVELAVARVPAVRDAWWGYRTHPADLLAEALRLFDPTTLAGADEIALVDPLARSVCSAMYWQEPFDREEYLIDRQVLDALGVVAATVLRAPGAAWWSSPVARDRQYAVTWGSTGRAPRSSAAEALASWRDSLVEEVRLATVDRPCDLRSAGSGCWWSTPVQAALPDSARALGPWDSVGLFLVEECQGDFPSAVVQRLEIEGAARVYEIGEPEDWVRLAEQYPFDVTASRRGDWWRTTGWDGRWLIPDWHAVAEDFDGVHLTVSRLPGGRRPARCPSATPPR